MNHYQIAWLEQFLRPAIHLLAPLWPVIRPLLRLATALTAATVAFQLTAEEGLGIWLALGAGLMSWNFLFKAQPGFASAVQEVGRSQISTTEIENGVGDNCIDTLPDEVYCPLYSHKIENIWHDPLKD